MVIDFRSLQVKPNLQRIFVEVISQQPRCTDAFLRLKIKRLSFMMKLDVKIKEERHLSGI